MTPADTAAALVPPGLRAAYLERIGYTGPLDPTPETLRALHRAHMLAVPFENLDIYGGRKKLELDEAAFLRKVVYGRRGGYCYELNGAFGSLMRALGFDVGYLSGHTLSNGDEGPEFDHMLLLVTIGGEQYSADVGFGESSRTPLRLVDGLEQHDGTGTYRTTCADGTWSHWALGANGKWAELYRFTLETHPLAAFRGMFEYHQVSPKSPFTRNTICSLATDRGRVTLSGNRLTVVEDGDRTIRRLTPDETTAALRERFGVVLGD